MGSLFGEISDAPPTARFKPRIYKAYGCWQAKMESSYVDPALIETALEAVNIKNLTGHWPTKKVSQS